MTSTADPRRWALWRAPKPFVFLAVAVFLTAVAVVMPIRGSLRSDLPQFLTLAVAATICTTSCLRMERARKFLEAGNAPNLAATWTFAAALSLDHRFAAAIVAAVYIIQWSAQNKVYAGRPHRYLFGAGTVVIGVRVAQMAHGPVLTGLVLVGVNSVLIAGALVALSNRHGIRRMANPRAQLTELTTLVLGWVTATCLEWHLAAGFVAVPVLIGIQYLALCLSIRQPNVIDAETGALTPRAWNALGALRLSQSKEAVVFQVMVSDPGTTPWAACAEAVRGSVRPEDLIGRTSDGFSILVAGSGGELLAEMLALQMRARLAVSGMDTYVGFAVTPDRGIPVDLSGLAVTAGADAIVKAAQIRV